MDGEGGGLVRRAVLGLAVVALLAGGAYVVLARGNKRVQSCDAGSQACAGSECGPGSASVSAASESPRGKIAGNFDAAMSGVCRFACATKLKYDPKDVLAQPGAMAGKLTQCPVSGVVFAAETWRPRVHVGSDEFVTCCDKCATKLKNDAAHYLVSEGSMRVQLLSFDDCPNVVATRESLRAAMASVGITAPIEEVNLSSPGTPEPLRGWGSPTVLVNGMDVGGEQAPTGIACRFYRDEAGRMAEFPSVALLRAALVTGAKATR